MNKKAILHSLLGSKSFPSEHEKKLLRVAMRTAKYLAWIPGIQMVAVCNSLSYYAGNESSDIDLFIVSKPHYLWFVRILSTLIVMILWLRRTNNHIEWLVCLSFFATKRSLDFSSFKLEDDPYLEEWIRYLKPIVSYDNTYEEFIRANSWIEPIDSNLATENAHYLIRTLRSSFQKSFEFIFGWVFMFLDVVFRLLFLPRTKRKYLSLGKPFWVIISRDMLKFHPEDRRMELRDVIAQHKNTSS